MKILELHLNAFGPFTNRSLDLSHGAEGLHVLYGRNEAGKSSAMRALRALLYGIPGQTTDNFIHSYNDLRIAGRLRHSDGREITFNRRKGRKNTLLSLPDETPVEDGELAPYLSTVSEELFGNLFGIDHATLVRGGQEILEQKEEIGQTLYSAALGTGNLQKVLQELENEASDLYKPRGSNPSINKAILDYKKATRSMKEASLPGREWDRHHNDLTHAMTELRKIDTDLAGMRREQNRLERLQRILPRLATRRKSMEDREELGQVVELARDFGARRRDALDKKRSAQEILTKSRAKLERLREELVGLEIPREIFEQAETIEILHEKLGGHKKAAMDRPAQEGKRRQLKNDSRTLLKGIRPGLSLKEVEELRPVLTQRRRIQDLANQYQALINGESQAVESLNEANEKIVKADSDLAAIPDAKDPKKLKRVLAAARRDGDLDGDLGLVLEETRIEEQESQVEIESLGLWKGSLDELERLPVPQEESLDRFESTFQDINTRHRDLKKECRKTLEDLGGIGRELQEIELAGEVPAEADLERSRAHRDRGWALLKRRWLENEDVAKDAIAFHPDLDLHEAFEASVGEADEVSDRLRRETERVHKKADLLWRQDHLEAMRKKQEDEVTKIASESKKEQEAWSDLWRACDINPLTPREMHAWLRTSKSLRVRAADLRRARSKIENLRSSRSRHRDSLIHELDLLGETVDETDEALEPILQRAEGLVEIIEQENASRTQLQQNIRKLQDQRAKALDQQKKAAGDLGKWRQEWKGAVEDLGLTADARPSQATEVLETLAEVFSKLDDVDALDRRIWAIDKDAQEYEAEVRSFAESVLPGFKDLPAVQTVVQLTSLLKKARDHDARRLELEKQIRDREEEIEDAESTLGAASERLTELCLEAHCNEVEKLEEAENRSDRLRELGDVITRIEDQLREGGEGAGVDDLCREAEGVDPHALPGQIDQVSQQIEEFDERRKALLETKGAEENELRRMNGAATAANAAEEAQEIVAGLSGRVEQYLRLRVASRILKKQIERYRAENQDPILSRGGEVFADLTLGSFRTLQTDFNEKNDSPYLVGVRESGERVPVDGMSSGTRDQLYLALRLATLERYLDTSEPMPFIVDDVLINFDDERSEATLKVLGTLSSRTQVLMFTHHSRIRDLAQKSQATGVFLHELS